MALSKLALVAAATTFAAYAGAASAQAPLPTMIQVSMPGDGAMSCPDLAAEIGRMDQIMGQSQQNQASAQSGGMMAGVLGSAAVNGAAYSGVLGRVPGLGFLAGGAQRMAQQNAEQKAAEQAKLQQDAQMRRTMISGIYQGKACDQPQAQAIATPVAPVAPAVPGAPEAPAAPAATEASFAPAGAAPAQ